MFNKRLKGDKWTNINTTSVALSNFVGIFFCVNKSLTIMAGESVESKNTAMAFGIFFAAMSLYGVSYNTYFANLKSQRLSISDIYIESDLEEYLISSENESNSFHEFMILYGVIASSWMSCVFPSLFLINELISESSPKYIKISLVAGASFFGALASVGPARSFKNNQIENSL